MKKFVVGLIGILLLIIYVLLVTLTFVVTSISKLLCWVTNHAQNILERIKGDFQYGEN